MTTFLTLDLYPGGRRHGVQGQICDILTPASYESLPAPSGHTDSHTLDHRVHRVATAAFWRTFSDEGKISPDW